MFFLDTNAVIAAVTKRRPHVAARLDAELEAGTRILISTIVLLELRYGEAKSERQAENARRLDDFLAAALEIVPFVEVMPPRLERSAPRWSARARRSATTTSSSPPRRGGAGRCS